jgi:disulfide bond formation protein DsbB
LDRIIARITFFANDVTVHFQGSPATAKGCDIDPTFLWTFKRANNCHCHFKDFTSKECGYKAHEILPMIFNAMNMFIQACKRLQFTENIFGEAW